ncbi:cytoplasmic 60S subunit biogenesis factor ZNF622-like [Chionomys nivalis]|uniref:cytoplasmic 60S subunit biogenesis factor ZNF622-like n=1 Tax=Chionomys nivalis TaxID=269649 RepID=UPI002597C85A|nr:cytoplasmic 60S subunit biogenesis factor ZNF622-like [Chionomys nivalis]
MAGYSCLTCRMAFPDSEMQRAHYKTDWHLYNLRRKVANMAPVTAEGFQERLQAQRAVAEEESKGTANYCTVCSKKFATFSAYENHLKSRRHVELEKGLGADSSVGKDVMNAAIQQAIKAQPSTSPKKVPSVPAEGSQRATGPRRGAQDPDPAEKPPRLQWFEQQARKLAKQRWEESEQEEEDEDQEEDWEDIDSDDGLECENPGQNDEDEEAGESPPPGAIPITDCLFCSHHSSSLMKNVAHMTKIHSFFIPDIEYLSDLKGLVKYLGEKVGVGKICLWCNERGKSFYSTEAVQAHMNDKSHCKLFADGDAALEFADFYDFRSSYPDYKEGQDPDEIEELSSEKTLEWDDETMELILPSGARVGHCSLMRYYKQRSGLSRTVTAARNQKAVGRVLQQYRAPWWTGSTGAALVRERDMQYVQRMKSKWMLKTGMKNNATKQMHFRAQVLF